MTYRYRLLSLLAAVLISALGHWGLISFFSSISSDVRQPVERVTQVHVDLSVEAAPQTAETPAFVTTQPTAPSTVVQKPASPSSVTRTLQATNGNAGTEPPLPTSSADNQGATTSSTPQAPSTGTQGSTSGGALAAGAIALIRGSGTEAGVPASDRQTAPRKQSINQTTKDVRYRQYAEDWRQKVERVGKVAFPENTDPNAPLRGRVLIRVIIKSDGSIAQLGVVRSSKNKVLDAAALNIVRLAAPFSPFPASFKDEVDLIEITRWWSFEEIFK